MSKVGEVVVSSVGGAILTEASFLSFELSPVTSNPTSTSCVSNLDRVSLFSIHTGILHLTSSSVALPVVYVLASESDKPADGDFE